MGIIGTANIALAAFISLVSFIIWLVVRSGKRQKCDHEVD
ncbi:hypothetical protein HNR44_001693 [Geomicrobium halophilum]|uniref:Uncharacterized protein n=1 Tax=Geomicrobium halophilum TaxID=549000 RepID=A0A841PZ98_9BACL|nr:hypothetical protein [Geomicrobium halophilum]